MHVSIINIPQVQQNTGRHLQSGVTAFTTNLHIILLRLNQTTVLQWMLVWDCQRNGCGNNWGFLKNFRALQSPAIVLSSDNQQMCWSCWNRTDVLHPHTFWFTDTRLWRDRGWFGRDVTTDYFARPCKFLLKFLHIWESPFSNYVGYLSQTSETGT